MTIYVLGLDGASLPLVQDSVKTGRLPNFERVLREGASAELRSVYPYVTAPAWSSLFSGVNPGKHGVFDQLTIENGVAKVSNMRRSDVSFLWDYASSARKKILAVGIPFVYPAPWVNGVFVSGRFVREISSFPPEIEKSFDLSGFDDMKYESVKPRLRRSKYGRSLMMRRMNTDLRRRFKTAKELMKSAKWDLVVLVDGFPDEFLHFDPLNETAKMEMFRTIDDWLGDVTSEMGEEDSLMIVSDHGFGDTSKVFYMKQWLTSKKYIPAETKVPQRALRSRFKKRIDSAVGRIPAVEGISNQIQLRRGKTTNIRTDELSKERRAYLIPPPASGSLVMALGTQNMVWISYLQKVGPRGGPLESEILSDLQELKGMGLIRNVYRSLELYHGEHSKETPGELLVEPYDDCMIDKDKLTGGKIYKEVVGKPGRHRLDGLFISYGSTRFNMPPVVSICDVLPTLLAMLRIPIPSSLDGRPLEFAP